MHNLNLKPQSSHVDGSPFVEMVALSDIDKGAELLWNYGDGDDDWIDD